MLDRAYHGHTWATLQLSPYKYEHKGNVEHVLYVALTNQDEPAEKCDM